MKKVRINLFIDKELRKKLNKVCIDQETNMTQFIIMLIKNAVE